MYDSVIYRSDMVTAHITALKLGLKKARKKKHELQGGPYGC